MSRMPAWQRPVAWGFAVLFGVGVAVQWNDPDPLPWMGAYAIGAGLSVAAATGRRWPLVTGVAALAYLVAAIFVARGLDAPPLEAFTSFEMRAADHEAPREVAGLLLLAAWTGLLAWLGRSPGTAPPGADGREGPRS